MGKSVRNTGNLFVDEFGEEEPKAKITTTKKESPATEKKSGANLFVESFGVEKKSPSEITGETSSTGTKPIAPSQSASTSVVQETPTDNKERYDAIANADAQALLTSYQNKGKEKNLEVINNPFGGGRQYKDFAQSREGKTGLIVSNILEKGQFQAEDINYLAKVAPAAVKQLVQAFVKDADQTNLLSPENLNKLVNDGRDVADAAITKRKVENNQQLNSSVKKTLADLQIDPTKLNDVAYAESVSKDYEGKKNNELAALDKKYPVEKVAKVSGRNRYYEDVRAKSREYNIEKSEIEAKYSNIQNAIGLTKAFDLAAKNPTFTPLEIGLEYLKYADPDTYKLREKAGGKWSGNRDVAEIGTKALYATGNAGAIELAKKDEINLDDQYPDKRKAEVMHRLGAELYKDENWFFNPAPGVDRLDKAAQQLIQSDRDFYYKHIRNEEKRNIGTEVPLSGFVNKVGEGIGSTGNETWNFIGDVISTLDKKLKINSGAGRSEKAQSIDALEEGNRTRFQDVGTYAPAVQQLKELNSKQKKGEKLTPDEIEKKQDLETFTGVRSTAQEIIDGTGNLTGQVIFQALATKGLAAAAGAGLKGAGLLRATEVASGLATEDAIASSAVNFGVSKAAVTEVAATAIAYASSYDAAKRDALRLMPQDKDAGKRTLYATIVGGLNAGTERIFKDEKVLGAFNKEISPNIKTLVSKLSAGELSKEALAPALTKVLLKSKEFVKESLIANTKESTEELATSVGQSIATSILAPTKFNEKQAYNDAISTFTTTFLHGGLVAGLAGTQSFKANHIGIPTLSKIGIDQKLTEDTKGFINAQLLSGNMSQEEANGKFKILNTASKINTEVMPQVQKIGKLPQKTAEKYGVQLLNENVLKESAAQAKADGDTVLEAKYNSQIKESEKIRKDILDKKLFVDDNYTVKTEDEINGEQVAEEAGSITPQETQSLDDAKKMVVEMADEGLIPDTLVKQAKEDPESFLKTIYQQANNVDEAGNKVEGDATQATKDQFTETLVDTANEVFPIIQKISKSKTNEKVSTSKEGGSQESSKSGIEESRSQSSDQEGTALNTNESEVITPIQEGVDKTTPIEDIYFMSSDELGERQRQSKNLDKQALKDAMGEEWVKEYGLADAEMKSKMEDALTPEQKKVFGGEVVLERNNPEVIKNLRAKIASVESAENAEELKSEIGKAITDISNNRNRKQAVAVLNASAKRADELGLNRKELQQASIADLMDKIGNEDAKSILNSYFNKPKVRVTADELQAAQPKIKKEESNKSYSEKNVKKESNKPVIVGRKGLADELRKILGNESLGLNPAEQTTSVKLTDLQKTEIASAIDLRKDTVSEDPDSATEFELGDGNLETLENKINSGDFNFTPNELQFLLEEFTERKEVGTSFTQNEGIRGQSFLNSMEQAINKVMAAQKSSLALNRNGDTNPQNRISFEDLGIKEGDTLNDVMDKLIAYGGEFTQILEAIKADPNFANVTLELVDKRGGLKDGESGLYHPVGHGEGKDGLLQIANKDNAYYTAAHELLHFLTLDSKVAEDVKDGVGYKGLEDMYNYIASKKGKPVAGQATVESYGLTNAKEFMAELLINPTFRKYVGDVFSENKEDILKASKNLRDSKTNSIGDLVLNFFKDLFEKIFSSGKSEIPFDQRKSVVDNAAQLATQLFFQGKDVTVGQSDTATGGTVVGMGSKDLKAAALALPSASSAQIKSFIDSAFERGESAEDIQGALVDNGFTEDEAKKLVSDSTTPAKPKNNDTEDGEFENKPKSILKNILGSTKIPKYVKDRFESEGLRYNPQSHTVAREMATDIIDEFGVVDSIEMAESGRFDGDVNSMIFAEGIDRTFEKEQKATTTEGKQKLAEQWADYVLRYDETARQKGKFISAVYDFYKKSPLGVVMAEKVRRGETFSKWYKGKENSFKEVFDEIKNEPQFKDYVKEQVESTLKEERQGTRKARRKKIENIFDSAKIKGDTLNSSIIPPQIWNGAMEVMKQAALAGESLVDVIESGISHIKSKHSEAFDEEKIRSDWGSQFKGIDSGSVSDIERHKENVRKQIDSLNEQIKNKKREKPSDSKKTETDEELKDLLKQREDLKDELQKVAPIENTEKYQKRILDRFRKKLSGLTDSQKEDVIRRSFKTLVENGALEYNEFKNIVADVMGLGDLPLEQVSKINQYVKDINSVQDAADNALETRSKKSIEDFEDATKKAEKSATKLGEIVNTKTDLVQRVRSIIQLNTLGAVSLIKNPFYNVAYQMMVRFPKAVFQTVLDQAIYGTSLLANKVIGTPIVKPDVNIFLGQMGYFRKAGKGTSESVGQVFTGLTNMDYFQKEIKSSQIKPLQAWRDIWAWKKGEKFLEGKEVVDRVIQGTVGIPAEAVARMLNIGDKPFRYAAEGAVAETVAQQEFNLKGIDKELFVRFPKEEATRLYKAKGMPHEEAVKKAEAIEKRIIAEGEQAVFQQKNLIMEGLNGLGSMMSNFAEDKPIPKTALTVGKVIGTLNAPFIKTPLNIFWDLFNLAVPEVALAQSAIYGFLAAQNKYKGDNAKAAEYALQAKKWTAHAATGYALLKMLGYFASIGAISGSDDEDKGKERKGKKLYTRPKSLNVSKITRAFTGESTQDEDGDLLVDLSWFGSPGVVMNMQANRYENMTAEDRTKGEAVGGIFERMNGAAVDGLENSIFQGTIAGLNAFKQGGRWVNTWALNQINVGSNFFQPATLSQFARATLPYNPSIKADSFSEELKNNFASRSLLFRMAAGYPPSDITIWGDPAMRNNTGAKGVAFNMLGFDEYNKNTFAEPVFQDFKKTGNSSFFPTEVKGTLTVDGQSMKMDVEQERQFKTLVGQSRKSLVAPFVNEAAVFESKDESLNDKRYNEMSDEEKVKALNILYKKGYDAGKSHFKLLYPEYQTKKEKAKLEEEAENN